MANEDSLQSIEYIKNSADVDDSYGNKDNVRDEKDVNFDLKNSIKNNLYITVPTNVNGVNYSNYIVNGSENIEKNIISYSNNMTIAEKLTLLMRMKKDIREQIIKNLKDNDDSDFYDSNSHEKIPFVAYWKMILPLEKNTYIKLTPSSSKISWIKDVTVKAALYDISGSLLNGDLISDFDGTHPTINGAYTFTVPKANRKVGTKTYTVKYNGVVKEHKGCSNSVKIEFVKDTPKIKALVSAGGIYNGHHAKYQFLNSAGTPITKTAIQINTNGSWKDYKTDSKGIVSIKITKAITIKYKFNGNDYYNSVAEKSQKFTIKSNDTKSGCFGKMQQDPTVRTPPYQTWSDLNGDCTTSDYLRCGHESTGDSNARTLGSKSGSYHRPSKLMKTMTLSVPAKATIKSVHVKWAEKQTNGPSASTSVTSFINIKTVTLKVSGAISKTTTINTNSGGKTYGGKWVSHDINLGTSFDSSKDLQLELIYGPNTSDNVGTIYLKGPQVIVEYIPAEK